MEDISPKRIVLQGNKFLVTGGKIGVGSNCCCEGTCTAKGGAAGGVGTTVTTHLFPSAEHRICINYDAYSIPDRFKVSACGTQYIDTGSISGPGCRSFLKPSGCTQVTVTVIGPEGTAWEYEIACCSCPTPPPPPPEPCVCDVIAQDTVESDENCEGSPFLIDIPRWFKSQSVLEVSGNHYAVADSWAEGYPAAIADYRMFLVADYNRTEGSCTCDIRIDNNFVENICASAGWYEVRNRLMVLRCPEGQEPYLEDVTDAAIDTGSQRAAVDPNDEIPFLWAGHSVKEVDCFLEMAGDPPRLICQSGEADWYGTPTDWLPDPTVECDP
jgi:hypothetical protein